MVTEKKKAAKAQISSVFLEKKNGNPVDIQHLSSTRQVPGTVTGAGHSTVNETDKIFALWSRHFLKENRQ